MNLIIDYNLIPILVILHSFRSLHVKSYFFSLTVPCIFSVDPEHIGCSPHLLEGLPCQLINFVAFGGGRVSWLVVFTLVAAGCIQGLGCCSCCYGNTIAMVTKKMSQARGLFQEMLKSYKSIDPLMVFDSMFKGTTDMIFDILCTYILV